MQDGQHYHEEDEEEISSEENTKPELKQDFMLHYEKLCRGGANKVNHSLVNSVLTQPTLRYYELIQVFIGTSPAFSCAWCWPYNVLH